LLQKGKFEDGHEIEVVTMEKSMDADPSRTSKAEG